MKLSKAASVAAAGILAATASGAFAQENPFKEVQKQDEYYSFVVDACTKDGHTAHLAVDLPPLARARNKDLALVKAEALKTEFTATVREQVAEVTAADIENVQSDFNRYFGGTIINISRKYRVPMSVVYAHQPVTPGCTVK